MTKGEYVASAIKNEIRTGKWKVGDKLPSEAALCEAYNISRTSIRSAIHALAAEGVVTTQQGRGSFISSAHPNGSAAFAAFSDVQIGRIDLFEFRRIFEAESAALAASRADENTINLLRENVRRMQKAQQAEEAVQADIEFHYLIAEATQNAIMPEIYNMLRAVYTKMFYENVAIRGNDGCNEHLRVLSAIESRNPEQARQYMTEHLNQSMMQNTVSLYMQTKDE